MPLFSPRAASSDRPETFGPAPDFTFLGPLDAIRGIAITLVMAGHLHLIGMDIGRFGVTLFFFVSGLLITRLLLAEHRACGSVRIGAFYVRRLIRLYPAMLCVVVANTTCLWLLGVKTPPDKVLAALTYTINYRIIWSPWESWNQLFRVLWSLCVEWHFYVILPLFLSMALKRRWPLLVMLGGTIIGVMLWRAGLYDHCRQVTDLGVCGEAVRYRLYISTDTRIDSLLFGVAFSVLLAQDSAGRYLRVLTHPALVAAGMALLVASLAIPAPSFRLVYQYTLQGLALFPIMAAFLFAPWGAWGRGVMESRLPASVGKISYSLYLCHPPIMGAVAKTAIAQESLEWTVLIIVLSLLAATGCYFGIERPMIGWRRRFRLGKVEYDGPYDKTANMPKKQAGVA